MRLSKSDTVIAIIGITLLSILGYLLYADIMTRSGSGTTKLIGKIVSKRNTTERKFSSQVVWDDVYKDTKLYNFDTIRTADNAEATIRLIDGTVITLNENSMILLSISEKEVDIKFIQGTISASQSAQKDAASTNVNIVSGDSKISMKNSAVSLSQERENELQMTVNRGTATLKTGKEEKVINENQNILAGKDNIRLYDLTIKLSSPENNRYIPATAAKTDIAFSWERPKGDYRTFIELAANPTVSDPLIRKQVPGSAATIPLAEGVYYWRVTAIHNATKKIESSEIRKVSIVNNKPVILISPAEKSVIKYRDAKPMISFIWSKNASYSRYKLIVSGNPDLSQPVVDTIVEGNKISINTLGQSAYHWKVANISDIDQLNNIVESRVGAFSVTQTDTVEPPVPIMPINNRSIHPLSIQQKGLIFTWTKDPSIINTELIVGEDPDFSKTVLKKTSGDTSFRTMDRFNVGTYYWSLRGILRDGTRTEPSKPMRFKVAESGAINLIEPQDRAVIMNQHNEKTSRIGFSWSKTDLEGSYIVQLSKNRDFKPVLREMSAKDLSAEINDIPEGHYFWRVKMVDDNKTEILSSGMNSFDVMSLLDPPAIVGPLTGSIVNMLKKDTLDFFWKPARGANLYRIGLYQVKGGIQHSVAVFETRSTSYRFSALNKLDEGKFMWTIQALDADAATTRIRRKSEEIRSFFDITLGIKKGLRFDSNKILNTE